MPAKAPLHAVAAALAVLLAAPPAHAWRCARVLDNSGGQTGPAVAWGDRSIDWSFNAAGTETLDPQAAFDTVRAAFAVWQNSTLRDGEPEGCPATAVAGLPTATDVTFNEGPPTEQDYVGYNYLNPSTNKNVVIFRDTGWLHPLIGPSSELVAMTTTTYNTLTGEILDADIEFNTEGFALTVGDGNVLFDLLGAATHEVGHFLGLGHSDETQATMFGTAVRGEVAKRTLSCDDAAALWYRYPAGMPTSTCAPRRIDETCGFCAPPDVLVYAPTVTVQDRYDGRAGCSCGSADGALSLGVLLAAMGLRGARRWRRDRTGPSPR